MYALYHLIWSVVGIAWLLNILCINKMYAQTYRLRKVNDSLSYVQLQTDSSLHEWPLPYPIYQMQTADIDNNGTEEVLIGVVKGTRFYPQKARRLFIFKNVNGKIRPMWLGSRLAGSLQDFRCVNHHIRSLEKRGDKWLVAEFKMGQFGPSFIRYLIYDTTEQEAKKQFKR